MRVTVLGGTGRIGRHVVDQLLAVDNQVVAQLTDRTYLRAAPAISN